MRCSGDLAGWSRSPAQRAICVAVAMPRSSARSSSEAPTINASGLVDRHNPRGDSVAAAAQQHPQRLPVAAVARQR